MFRILLGSTRQYGGGASTTMTVASVSACVDGVHSYAGGGSSRRIRFNRALLLSCQTAIEANLPEMTRLSICWLFVRRGANTGVARGRLNLSCSRERSYSGYRRSMRDVLQVKHPLDHGCLVERCNNIRRANSINDNCPVSRTTRAPVEIRFAVERFTRCSR